MNGGLEERVSLEWVSGGVESFELGSNCRNDTFFNVQHALSVLHGLSVCYRRKNHLGVYQLHIRIRLRFYI